VFIAVIPVKNEAGNLARVISNLPGHCIDLVVPVLNGCTDNSLAVLEQLNCPRLAPLCFTEPLGIDIPRAVGAVEALRLDAEGVLFLDGDMTGADMNILEKLVRSVRENGLDLALTDCYPPYIHRHLSPQASCLLKMREKLNRQIGLLKKIGTATPSHGPHAVSGRLLRSVTPYDFAVPPLLLARAALQGLKIGLGAEIAHTQLGSPVRGADHAQNIVETIIGDCLSAMGMVNGKQDGRVFGGREFTGYHAQRRWDILKNFISGRVTGDCF